MTTVPREGDPSSTSDGNARGGIQALDAALVLLRTLATFPNPVSLAELARAANMPPSKAHRYLASFVHAGLVVQRGRSGRYDLGPRSAEMGLASLGRNALLSRVAGRLEELSVSTGLTALLTVWGNQGATVVHWERAPNFTVTSLGLGSTLPLLSSASGRIFLAFLPRRLTAARLRLEMDLARDAGISWPDAEPDPASIERLIVKVRHDRVAQVDGRFIPGLKAIAAPVTSRQGDVEVAVTLIGTGGDMLDLGGRVRHRLNEFVLGLSIRPSDGDVIGQPSPRPRAP